MGSEWKYKKIGEIGEVITGKTPKTDNENNFGFDIPFVTPCDLDGRRWIDSTERYLSLIGAESVKKNIIPENAVSVSCIGSDLGKAAIITKPSVTNQQINSVIPTENYCFKFIYYNLSARKAELQAIAGGSAQPIINKSDFSNVEILCPPLHTQKAISGILECFDNKIELNRQLNQTLEHMAQALFKSWFVDFDPVIDNALAAGNVIPDDLQDRALLRQGIRQQQLAKADHKLLPENIHKLFPSEFELTESLGWVPKGWGASQIKDCCEKIQNGGTPNRSTSEYWDNGTIPWLTSGEVRQKVVTKTENFITELGLKGSSAKPVAAGSTLIAMYGATAGQVAFSSVEVTTNQAVCALIPKTNCKYFVYLAMERCVASLENQARGSAQQNISKGIIEETLSVMPSVELLVQFDQVCASFFVSWICNLNMNEELAKLRDTLLPKLISGELRIPEAQAQLGEALV